MKKEKESLEKLPKPSTRIRNILGSIILSISLLLGNGNNFIKPKNVYAEKITRKQFENISKINIINIDSIYGYIKVDELIGGFADGKYKLENWIVKDLHIKHININNDIYGGKKITIWLENPFVIGLHFKKKESILTFNKSFRLLFDKKGNYFYLLGIIINKKVHLLRNPERYKIIKVKKEIVEKEKNKIIEKERNKTIEKERNKITKREKNKIIKKEKNEIIKRERNKVIEKERNKITKKDWEERMVKIYIPSIPWIGVEKGQLIIKLSEIKLSD